MMEQWYAQFKTGTRLDFHFHLQSNWIKGMSAVAKFTIKMGKEAVALVMKMEEHSSVIVTPYAFKCMEAMILQKDFEKLIKEGKLETKPNVQWLKQTVHDIVRMRYWTWVLMHPGLRPERVHPDKGVFQPISPSLTSFKTGARLDSYPLSQRPSRR